MKGKGRLHDPCQGDDNRFEESEPSRIREICGTIGPSFRQDLHASVEYPKAPPCIYQSYKHKEDPGSTDEHIIHLELISHPQSQ